MTDWHLIPLVSIKCIQGNGKEEKKMNDIGIIFDLDGVICFTDKYHYQAWKKMADEIQVYFDEKINDRLRGISRMASLEIILEHSERSYSQEEKERLADRKNEYYKALLNQMTPADLSDEVKSTMDELRKRGYRLALGSSSKNAKLILERLGLSGYFDAVSDGTNITHSKPDPEVFLKAAEFLGLPPEDCLVVEDAIAGIDAAVAANMRAVGIGDAAGYKKADYSLTRFADLLNI